MKINKIVIKNYKSIKDSVEINFTDSLPTVLIGKNGSGKTNILEALSAIADANGNYFGIGRDTTFDYEVHMQLSDEDVAKLFPGKNIDASKCNFVAYPGENMKINRIESEYLVPLLNAEIVKIQNTAKELKKAVNTYQKQLGFFYDNSDETLPFKWYQITNSRHTITNFAALSWAIQRPIEDADKIAQSLLNDFSGNNAVLNFTAAMSPYYPVNDDFSFKLEYVKPEFASFEAKFISIDEEKIKNEIVKINQKTKDLCDKITDLLKKIDEYTSRLRWALGDDELYPNKLSDGFYRFIYEIRKCIGTRCYFLKNENSNVIFKDEQSERQYYRNDDSFVILQTYINKVYDGADKSELLDKLKNDKEFSLPDKAITDFEAYLNKNRPVFEDEMYEKISARKAGKSVEIFLREKGGDDVSLNSTSSGRRWYFTYYFTKNALEKGDLLIVDEPASVLHPLAQKEVLKELCELEKQGIKVIYSTHSPYLIPNEWECVHFVSMGEKGTMVTKEEYFESLKQIADGDVFYLQVLIEKYYSCGRCEAAKNCCNALIKKYGGIEKAADVIGFSCDTLESWKKKRRGIDFPRLVKIAKMLDISPEKLL